MPSAAVQILSENPLLLLFLVVALGYPLGLLRIRGGSLGVAAVLFVGLAAGALDARLRLPETQPAVLGYALERTRNDVPNVGYASVTPAATLAKILLAQLLLLFG